MSRRQILGWSLVLLVWFLFIFIHLYEFSYPNMDSWCYFAPAAFARYPFDLSTPLLGDFKGAATTWGLNWPGGELIASLFTPLMRGSGRLYVAWFCLQWLALGVISAYLIQKITRNIILAALGAGLILTDRILFSVAWLQRHELLAINILLGLIILCPVAASSPWRKRELLLWCLGFFVLPWLQPASGPAGLFLAALMILVSIVTRQYWRESITAGVSLVLGILGLVAYFYFQPEAWAYFQDHAAVNVELTRQKPAFPPAQWLNLWEHYSRAPSGLIIYGLGLIAAVMFIWQGLRKNRFWLQDRNRIRIFLITTLFVVLFVICHKTYNGYYLALVFPLAVIILAVWLTERQFFVRIPRQVQIILAIGFIGIHSLFLSYRTYVLYRADFPRIRQELQKTAELLPEARVLLIPEVLWENYVVSSRLVRLNTLPYNASESLREAYEKEICRDLKPGDILVVDQVQAQPPRYQIRPEEWEVIAHYRCGYTSSKFRGFDLTVFRRK